MSVSEKKDMAKAGVKEQEIEHAHQKYRGLINGELAKQLYFLQCFRKEEEKLKHDHQRFKNGTRDMRKKLAAARKKRKKAQANLASADESCAILSQDTEIAKHRANELRRQVREFKEERAQQQLDVRHGIVSLHGLEEDIVEQVKQINRDIWDVGSAFAEWSKITEDNMMKLESSREKCYAAFDDWSTLWPGVYGTLSTETSLTASAKSVATLQGVIGEWRALRATALSVKMLNMAMEAAAKASVNDPSIQPYDYNEKLRKLQMSLMAKSLSLKSRTTTANNDITALNNLRKRLKNMLMDMSAAVESDMHFCIDHLEEEASMSLNEHEAREKKQPIRNNNDVRVHRQSDGTKVKHWLQHTILSGESTDVMDHVEEVMKQQQRAPNESLKRGKGKGKGKGLNSDERVNMYRGALHAKDLETIREHLGIDVEHVNHYRSQSNRPTTTDSDQFSAESMTTVLAALECRKAFDDVQWAVEKYKATLSKNWTDAERDSLDPVYVERAVEKETKREIEAQLGSFNGWMSYQLSARQLASGLNVAFPCPVDHLVKHAVAAAKDLNSRERPPTGNPGAKNGRKQLNPNNASNNMQKLAAQKASEKHRAQLVNATASNPQTVSLDIKPMQPLGPAPSSTTPQRVKRVAGVVAGHTQPSTGIPTAGGRKAAGSMIAPSTSSNNFPFRKDSGSASVPPKAPSSHLLTSGGALDEEDSADDNDSVSTVGRGRVGRGESVRSSMNRVMMEDQNAAAKLEANSVDKSDRLLVHVTSRIPFSLPAKQVGHRHQHHGSASGERETASEAMTVALWWQDEEERLKISLVNITGTESYTLLINQANIEEIFEDNKDLKYSNMTNQTLCQALISRLRIEKASRTAAYNLLVSAKTFGVRKAFSMMATPLVDISTEEDTVRLLTIRNNKNELLICSLARMKSDHLQNLAKALPKREAHVGGVEQMLAKEKAPVKSARTTMF